MTEYGVKERFHSQLLPNEYIVWCGQPNAKVHLSKSDLFLIPFSLLWGGFAFYWNWLVWSSGAPFFFRIFGLPFLLMGLYILLGRFVHAAYNKKRTFYAITNMRILIIHNKRGLLSQYICDTHNASTTVRKNGNGTIAFGVHTIGRRNGAFYPVGIHSAAFAFVDIDNCPAVFKEYQILKHNISQ